jgi:hypothetical protein
LRADNDLVDLKDMLPTCVREITELAESEAFATFFQSLLSAKRCVGFTWSPAFSDDVASGIIVAF